MQSRNPEKANKNIPIQTLLDSYDEHRTWAAVGRELGMDPRGVQRRVTRYLSVQAGHRNLDDKIPDYAPGAGRKITKVSTTLDKHGNPNSYAIQERAQTKGEDEFAHPLDKIKRVSTLRGADGSITAQWEITENEKERTKEAFDQIIEGFKEEIPRTLPQEPLHLNHLTHLHNNYVLSDAHIGALAWKPESGADWDLKIAEEMLTKAMSAMISQSPRARTCTVALLGDWMHYDKLEAVTTLSGNILDSDGRQPKMNKIAIRVARNVVTQALGAHEKVELLVAEGNHDIIAANWLRELFIVAFENEPRVNVIDESRPYYASMHGDVLHCWHHGHLKGAPQIKQAEQLVALFADEYRDLWGRAKKVYVNTGHLHFQTVSEPRGARVMQHPTLATRDSWAARRGYGSMREARGSTYHAKYGAVSEAIVSPEMLEDL